MQPLHLQGGGRDLRAEREWVQDLDLCAEPQQRVVGGSIDSIGSVRVIHPSAACTGGPRTADTAAGSTTASRTHPTGVMRIRAVRVCSPEVKSARWAHQNPARSNAGGRSAGSSSAVARPIRSIR